MYKNLGHFTSSDDLNLIVAKHSLLEIYLVQPEGLHPLKEVGVNGKIAVLKHFRPEVMQMLFHCFENQFELYLNLCRKLFFQDEKRDRLFVLTQQYDAMILEFEVNADGRFDVITKAHGNVATNAYGSKVEGDILAAIDPEARVIGLRLYEERFLIIPLAHGTSELNATTIK